MKECCGCHAVITGRAGTSSNAAVWGGIAGTRLVDMERNGACLIRQLDLEPGQL